MVRSVPAAPLLCALPGLCFNCLICVFLMTEKNIEVVFPLVFVVRLFPEITIKSPSVRKRWTKHLVENLRLLMRGICPGLHVLQDWDRIEVRVPTDAPEVCEKIVDILSRTPGIAHSLRTCSYDFESMHDIYERAYEHWGDQLTGKTFCVRVKRTGQHDYTSTDVERYVGGGLNQHCNTAGVRLVNPEVTVNVEIKNQTCYVVAEKYPGLGGFPVGTQESVLSLVSGGFDSTVASYMMIKRGLKTHYCFFNLGGLAHEIGVKEIAFYLWQRFGSTHKVRFVTVPFDKVVAEILTQIDPSNVGVVLKRMMLRAAEKLAKRGQIPALVTGEAVAQVSSQTMHNLAVIDKVVDTMIFRPLVVTDKRDIINMARDIGAEEFSANIPEYCGVISVKPSSRVNEEHVIEQEARFDFDILDQAVEQSVMQPIDKVMATQSSLPQVPQKDSLVAGDVVIDVRHPDEQSLKPLVLSDNQVLTIPFFKLSTAFVALEKEGEKGRSYLLYCEKGVMSELHAAQLASEGYTDICVYRP